MPKKPDSNGCPQCSSPTTKVVSVIRGGEGGSVLRRRRCESCDHRWYTLQQPEVVLRKHQVTFQRDDDNSPLFTVRP